VARILIAAINYWPEPSGTAPYTTQFAEHLAARGADVSVLTGMPHYPAWRVSPAYARVRRATESKDGVTIIRRSHLVPSTQSALSRAAYEASFFVHALVLRGRWDATIGIVPSLNGGALARVHARRRYGVIFQDVMGSAVTQSGIRGGRSAVATATRAAERWVVRKARAVGAVSESFFP
jgi:colanic acid biosynthesis glycosyl transferase WcaI